VRELREQQLTNVHESVTSLYERCYIQQVPNTMLILSSILLTLIRWLKGKPLNNAVQDKLFIT